MLENTHDHILHSLAAILNWSFLRFFFRPRAVAVADAGLRRAGRWDERHLVVRQAQHAPRPHQRGAETTLLLLLTCFFSTL